MSKKSNRRKARETMRKLRHEHAKETERELDRNKAYYKRGKGKVLVNVDSLVEADNGDDDEDNNAYAALLSDHGKGADEIRSFEERTPEALAKADAEAEARELALAEEYRLKKRHVICRLREIGKGYLVGTFRGLCREFIETKTPNDSIENKRERIILCGAQQIKRKHSARQSTMPQDKNTTTT